MNLSLRRYTVLAIALLSMLALSASAAFAQYPPAPAFDVVCTADGEGNVDCAIVGAEANENLAVTATCDGEVVYNETLTADEDGEAFFSFTAAGADECLVQVLGESSGAAATQVADVDEGAADDGVADDGVADDGVAGAPVAGGTLPLTGGEVGVLLLIALTLLGFGLLALRRREDSKVAADA